MLRIAIFFFWASTITPVMASANSIMYITSSTAMSGSNNEITRSSEVNTKDPFNKENFRNQAVELSYILIPESFTHGADLHIDFISFPEKKSVVKFQVGIGGGFGQHVYKNEAFTEYTADVQMRRIFGHSTMGLRLFNRAGGITIRSGYNYMAGLYEYDYTFPNGIIIPGADEKQTKHFHRVHMEAVLFKSFKKQKPGIGILAGIKYLRAPGQDGRDVILIKAGFGF